MMRMLMWRPAAGTEVGVVVVREAAAAAAAAADPEPEAY